MATTIELLPVDAEIKIGETQKFTAVVSGAPVDATTTYVWTVDEVTQSSTLSTLDYVGTTAGTKAIKVVATTSAQDTEDDVQEATVNLVVNKKDLPSIEIAVDGPTKVKLGESYTLTVSATGVPADCTATYLWDKGETTDTVNRVGEAVGSEQSTVTVTVSGNDYETQDFPGSITVQVADEIPAECPILYIHPLPHRNSAYIWAGWWVMDAIQKISEEGKDWKTATSEDTPYYCHLATLAKMINDYPEVDVQESRNGRIVHRSALEVGIIY